jgi:hypothetical protein
MMTSRRDEMQRRGGRWVRNKDLYREGHLVLFIRKIARTLKMENLLCRDSCAVLAGRNDGTGRDRKRIGGRWVPREERFSEPNAVLRAVAGRCWYVLVPFVGLAWANAAYVRPAVENIRSTKNVERQVALDHKDDLRSQISELQTAIFETGARIDTLYTPQITYHRMILDSVLLARKASERNPTRLRARIDSLSAFRDYLVNALDEGTTTLRNQSATHGNLEGYHAVLQDEIADLDHHIARNTAELNRRAQPRDLHAMASRFWYVLAPAVGMVWAHDS